ncbi:unnamed protein product, partial [Scytosiphon promiscuus]
VLGQQPSVTPGENMNEVQILHRAVPWRSEHTLVDSKVQFVCSRVFRPRGSVLQYAWGCRSYLLNALPQSSIRFLVVVAPCWYGFFRCVGSTLGRSLLLACLPAHRA